MNDTLYGVWRHPFISFSCPRPRPRDGLRTIIVLPISMDRWRSKELRDIHTHAATVVGCSEDEVTRTLGTLVPSAEAFASAVRYTPTFPKDIGLPAWAAEQTHTQGGAAWMHTCMSRPTTDMEVLRARQRGLRKLARRFPRGAPVLEELAASEEDVLWILSRPPLSDAWPVPLLFPTWPVLSAINRVPWVLQLYHMSRIYLSPWMNLVYPLATLLGPWVYLRRNLGWDVPFVVYAGMLRLALRQVLRPTGDVKKDAARYGTLLLYGMLYVYGVFQSIDMSIMLHRLRSQLVARLERIRSFVAKAESLLARIPPHLLQPFMGRGHDGHERQHTPLLARIPSGIRGMYALWTDSRLQAQLRSLLQRVYVADVALTASGWRNRRGWCSVSWVAGGADTAALWDMGHPALPPSQVPNPACLAKNLLMTGPNAAGKTTYAKSLCSNLWIAQVFGIACAQRARLPVFHAFGSFVRIEDSLGTESLFEAEARRCGELWNLACDVSAHGRNGFFFLDEPMHSTPPTEGASVATAVCKHMGGLPGMRMIVTTHYHAMTTLVGDAFHNISMEASDDGKGGFGFPYHLCEGPSFQCIALELLGVKALPQEVLQSAAETRDIICRGFVNGREE